MNIFSQEDTQWWKVLHVVTAQQNLNSCLWAWHCRVEGLPHLWLMALQKKKMIKGKKPSDNTARVSPASFYEITSKVTSNFVISGYIVIMTRKTKTSPQKRMMTYQGGKSVQYGKAMSYLQTDFQLFGVSDYTPKEVQYRAAFHGNHKEIILQCLSKCLCDRLLYQREWQPPNKTFIWSSFILYTGTHTQRHIYISISMYFYTHAYIWM